LKISEKKEKKRKEKERRFQGGVLGEREKKKEGEDEPASEGGAKERENPISLRRGWKGEGKKIAPQKAN